MEFKEYLIKDIATVQTGPFGSQLHKKDYIENGTPIITVEHLGDNKISHQNMPRVKEIDVKRLSKYNLKENDIVFSRVGSVDRSALVSEKEDGWLFSGRCLRVRTTTDLIDPVFLSYYFRQYQFREYIRNVAVGATMPSINTKILSNIVISIPRIDVQKKIASTLHKIDQKVWLNENVIKNLEQLAQALFKRWFVDFEFPNENGDPYKSSGGEMVESELGMIPAGWEVVELNDICKDRTENYSPREDWSYINYLDTGNITDNHILNIQRIDTIKQKIPSRARRKVQANDIIYSTVRPNQKHYGLIREPLNNMLVSTGFAILRTKGMYPSNQLFLWLTQKEITDKLHSIAEQSTSAYPSIKADDIMMMKILQPFQNILRSFNGIVEAQFKKIWESQQENKRLSALRDVLLPKLLSGEIELPNETEVTEDVPIS